MKQSKHENDGLPGGKNDPFTVPDGFFETFKTDLLDFTHEKVQMRVIHLIRTAGKYAAILCVLFFAGKGVISTFAPDRSEPFYFSGTNHDIDIIYTQVSEQELTEYIVEELEDELPYYTDF